MLTFYVLSDRKPNAYFALKVQGQGHLGGSAVKQLPLAQVIMPGSWDRAPRLAPCFAGNLLFLLPLPLPLPSTCALSLISSILKKEKGAWGSFLGVMKLITVVLVTQMCVFIKELYNY